MVTSENILKLRELTEKIGKSNPINNDSLVIEDLKNVLEEVKEQVSHSNSPNSKLKCYEKMCEKITNIINNKF